jgi:NCAIR mutase (PurE)-related protein
MRQLFIDIDYSSTKFALGSGAKGCLSRPVGCVVVVVAWARGHATGVIERIAEAPSLALGVLLFASYGDNSGGVSAVWSSLKALSRCE